MIGALLITEGFSFQSLRCLESTRSIAVSSTGFLKVQQKTEKRRN